MVFGCFFIHCGECPNSSIGTGPAMRAFETFVVYVTPFLFLGAAAKFLMKRRAVDLPDIQAQAGRNRRPRRAFLLGSWRTERDN
jgi:hypothetical protein